MRFIACAPLVASSALVLVNFVAIEFSRGETPIGTIAPVSTSRPVPAVDAPPSGEHPLRAVIDYARSEQQYLGQTVRDFSCRLVKRERIDGFLQDMHFIDMDVREGVRDDAAGQPLSIYLHFLGPKSVVGRNVLYIEGANDGKMLVRNGGKHFDYVIAKIDPLSDTAREETLVPVTEIGFNRLLNKMIGVLEKHQGIDPSGKNTKTQRISGAKINNRVCTVIRITHPRPMTGLEFHVANVFVDNDLHAPVRIDYSDWPRSEGGTAPLIAEYTYTDLQLNVGLPNAAFSPARLREN